jgi:hypothetical protein
VLSKERGPASRSWERWAGMQQRWADNRRSAAAVGAPRAGPALLGGFLVCGRCGRRFLAAERGQANRRRYTCRQATMRSGAPEGLRLAGNGGGRLGCRLSRMSASVRE